MVKNILSFIGVLTIAVLILSCLTEVYIHIGEHGRYSFSIQIGELYAEYPMQVDYGLDL